MLRRSGEIVSSLIEETDKLNYQRGGAVKTINFFFAVIGYGLLASSANALSPCKPLPEAIQVQPSNVRCGGAPAVILTKGWKNSFSAAFRWDDGSAEGQDRSPNALEDSSTSSSPYKTQKRLNSRTQDVLCYGKFLKRSGFPVPEQLTIKRTVAPQVKRFCVSESFE